MSVPWWNKLKIPAYPARGNDSVTFDLIDRNNGTVINAGSNICYRAYTGYLQSHSWIVHPVKEAMNSPLSQQDYFKWVDLCKANHIMPPDSRGDIVKNMPTITMSGFRHQVFPGLSCYRWAVNLGILPKLVLDLLDSNPNIHFFQAFHFALGKYNQWSNHSFSDFITNN